MSLDFLVVNMERAQRSICLRLDAYERLSVTGHDPARKRKFKIGCWWIMELGALMKAHPRAVLGSLLNEKQHASTGVMLLVGGSSV